MASDDKGDTIQRLLRQRNRHPQGSAEWQHWNWVFLERIGAATKCAQCGLIWDNSKLDRGLCGICRPICVDLDGPPDFIAGLIMQGDDTV